MIKLTQEQKIIISAYTGALLCDFIDLQSYAEKIMERPVASIEFTNEDFKQALKEKVWPDLLKII